MIMQIKHTAVYRYLKEKKIKSFNKSVTTSGGCKHTSQTGNKNIHVILQRIHVDVTKDTENKEDKTSIFFIELKLDICMYSSCSVFKSIV